MALGNSTSRLFKTQPVSPRRPPMLPPFERFRHRIEPARTPRPAARHPKQRHPSSGPQPMPGHCLVTVFRAGRNMATGIADETGQCQLVEADQTHAEQPAGCFPERSRPVAGSACLRLAFGVLTVWGAAHQG